VDIDAHKGGGGGYGPKNCHIKNKNAIKHEKSFCDNPNQVPPKKNLAKTPRNPLWISNHCASLYVDLIVA
jgi:hypothetical protein